MSGGNKSTRIGVLETSWYRGSNLAVRPLFEVLSHLNTTSGVDGYLYERFTGKKSFADAMQFLIASRKVSYIYVACHGKEPRRGQKIAYGKIDLEAGNTEPISRSEIRNKLFKAKGTFQGIYLAACFFGTGENLRYLLLDPPQRGRKRRRKNPAKWVASYQTSVPWIESAALDLLFWQTLLDAPKSKRAVGARIRYVAETLKKACPGLIRRFGFHIYVRKTGRGVVNESYDLLEDIYER